MYQSLLTKLVTQYKLLVKQYLPVYIKLGDVNKITMAKMKELDRVAQVVAENMLEQLYENIHWSMPADENLEGDEYMQMHNYIMSRALHYMFKLTKKK
jgi:hypothetical protein|tara:strand:+ start:9212 stop:9505 length:294 start_codon:yes stop_codon:yes gene_type:complete